MKKLILLLILLLEFPIYAQNSDKIFDGGEGYTAPVFEGGDQALLSYIASNIIYPEECKIYKIEGRVIIRATIEKNGSISNMEIIHSKYPQFEKEALRIVSNLHFLPATIDKVPVRAYYIIPVLFSLKTKDPQIITENTDEKKDPNKIHGTDYTYTPLEKLQKRNDVYREKTLIIIPHTNWCGSGKALLNDLDKMLVSYKGKYVLYIINIDDKNVKDEWEKIDPSQKVIPVIYFFYDRYGNYKKSQSGYSRQEQSCYDTIKKFFDECFDSNSH